MRIASVLKHDFAHLDSFYNCEGVVITNPDELMIGDIVVLHGGGDISPSYYNEKLHNRSKATLLPSKEDKQESAIIDRAIDMQLNLFGICRGAQWLCIKAGGKLVQHMDGHNGPDHPVILMQEDEVIWTNSSHHQMMDVRTIPGNNREILAIAATKSNKYGEFHEITMDALEAAYFPKIRGFATQGHPEWVSPNTRYVEWCLEKSKELWDDQ